MAGPSRCKLPQMSSKARKVNNAVDGSKKMLDGGHAVEAELVEQRLLHRLARTHHQLASAHPAETESVVWQTFKSEFFNKIRAERRLDRMLKTTIWRLAVLCSCHA